MKLTLSVIHILSVRTDFLLELSDLLMNFLDILRRHFAQGLYLSLDLWKMFFSLFSFVLKTLFLDFYNMALLKHVPLKIEAKNERILLCENNC